MVHYERKCWPDPYAEVIAGTKRHEVRKAERDLRRFDTITLREWDPNTCDYTGRTSVWDIGDVTEPGQWELPEDECVLRISNNSVKYAGNGFRRNLNWPQRRLLTLFSAYRIPRHASRVHIVIRRVCQEFKPVDLFK
jgi:hypothetical protein